jgi:hypothetical protein
MAIIGGPFTRVSSVLTNLTNLANLAVASQVLNFARGSIGKVFGDGGCSRFVAAALLASGADFNEADSNWGDLIGQTMGPLTAALNPTMNLVTGGAWWLPGLVGGDVLQFESAYFAGSTPDGGNYWSWFPHHSAIVTKVNGVVIEIANQNAPLGSAVHYDTINLAQMLASGIILAYRPRRKVGQAAAGLAVQPKTWRVGVGAVRQGTVRPAA